MTSLPPRVPKHAISLLPPDRRGREGARDRPARNHERNMKHVIKMILFTSFLVPAAYSAPSNEAAYVESYSGRTDVPVPISVVRPVIEPGHEGEVVKLSFVIDADGSPRDIMAPVEADRSLVLQLARAVEQWKFKPLLRDGQVVRTRVTLPFTIGETKDLGWVAKQ